MRIRTESKDDIDSVHQLLLRAFGGEDEKILMERLRIDPAINPELSIVAEDNGIVIGHIMFSPATLNDGGTLYQVAALGPLAVLPECQRRGVGEQLIEEGKKRCGAHGYPLVFLFGHKDYYPRFGFVQARAHGFEIRQFTVPDEVFMVAELHRGSLESMQGEFRFHSAFEGLG
ncbi:GNAT family N-acetyltransferase [Paenibacillus ihbetae]|uniref:GNAT family N-acetyltransferase n=1 Tax=Paenibacillus ihbetae TaxID=1870820 RepID=A0A1B2DVL6_9BACL|nr:N-acetyltransferase [Paenibacillus ihbetae]ANY71748.1 GNAT family N-acetyltransferase [Paenibacillus ihbetae]